MGLSNTKSNPFFTPPQQNMQREQSFAPVTSQSANGQALQFGQRTFTPPAQTGLPPKASVSPPNKLSATQQLADFKTQFKGHNLLSPTRPPEYSTTIGGGLSPTGQNFSALA
jgi:hypothetical protein